MHPMWLPNDDAMTLADLYRERCAVDSDIHEHLPFMVELVESLGATKVVELGTRSGLSTVAWLHALEATDGHLWSVDMDPAPDLGLEVDRWTFIQGDDCDPDVYSQLPSGADIVFIDTSHAYDHTLQELRLYRWLVRPGGRLVLHDTELPQPELVGPQPPYPVKKAVVEFCAAEGLRWTNRPNCWGLGIIEVMD